MRHFNRRAWLALGAAALMSGTAFAQSNYPIRRIAPLDAAGLEARTSTGAELQSSLEAEAERLGPLVKKLSIGQF